MTLLLPAWMGEGPFCLPKLLSLDRSRSWREGYRLLEQFDVTQPERAFARRLLRRKTNLWLFRTNQRQFAGDFVVVDMSAPGPAPSAAHATARRAWVLELKAGEAVHPAGGVQVQRWREALDEIAATHGILRVGAHAELLQGDPELLLVALGARAPAPKRAQLAQSAAIGD